jgi:hypothetical protein
MICKHCGEKIAKILDSWGYDNYHGVQYGFFHPDLVDVGNNGVYCRDRENEAEPAPDAPAGRAA